MFCVTLINCPPSILPEPATSSTTTIVNLPPSNPIFLSIRNSYIICLHYLSQTLLSKKAPKKTKLRTRKL